MMDITRDYDDIVLPFIIPKMYVTEDGNPYSLWRFLFIYSREEGLVEHAMRWEQC